MCSSVLIRKLGRKFRRCRFCVDYRSEGEKGKYGWQFVNYGGPEVDTNEENSEQEEEEEGRRDESLEDGFDDDEDDVMDARRGGGGWLCWRRKRSIIPTAMEVYGEGV